MIWSHSQNLRFHRFLLSDKKVINSLNLNWIHLVLVSFFLGLKKKANIKHIIVPKI